MENLQGSGSHEPLKPLIKPIIEYDPSLQKEDVPYVVSIDSGKCGILLHELGISDEKIGSLKIILARRLEVAQEVAHGGYNMYDGSITICTDPIWRTYKGYLETAKQIADKRKKPSGQFKNFLYTKKLEAYLEKAPSERGVCFSSKLIGGAVNREFRKILFHESKHAADMRSELARALYFLFRVATLGIKIGVFLLWSSDTSIGIRIGNVVYYNTDPIEKRAFLFEKKERDNPRWNNILTIIPKQKQ